MKITSKQKQRNKISIQNLRVRRSPILLIARLVLLNIIFLILLLAIRSALTILLPNLQVGDVYGAYLIVYGVLGLGVLGLTIYVVLAWKNSYYEIKPHSIVVHKGIFAKKEINFACNRIESITVKTTMIGNLFDFGTISLYDPFLEKHIYLANIGQPEQIVKALKNIYITLQK